MNDLNQYLSHKLEERVEKGNLRRLNCQDYPIDFLSNDYLGLSRNKDLGREISEYAQSYSSHGSTGSRLLSGDSPFAHETESFLARQFNSASALLFSSGYLANIAVMSSIPQKGDTIIYDELSHACIKDGARLSFAQRYSFRHNDIEDMSRKMEKATGRIYLVVESIYSMDGDRAPLDEIYAIAKANDAILIVDEAHSTGTYGKNGCGLAADFKDIIRIMTFGKGVGAHGACVVGSLKLKEYLINFARPFIYTTALPMQSMVAIRKGMEYISRYSTIQQDLYDRIDYFKEIASKAGLGDQHGASAIQAILIPGNERVKKVVRYLNKERMDVRAILSPTVREGEERIRICIHNFNTYQEIDDLIHKLKSHLA